jgi:AcrR family transcriptional regulator
VQAAWVAVKEEGLAGLSLRDLARRARTTTPTIYNYFASKNDIYDAMFEQAASEFEAYSTAPYSNDEPRAVLTEGLQRFVKFCTADIARYQLLFQRTIPGFDPSESAYAPALRALKASKDRLALNGITDPHHADLWTALTTGLVSQQIANDPGGSRWTRLVEDAVAMFLDYCQPPKHRKRPNS